MNHLSVLDNFLAAASDDHRIHPAHISLYVALFQAWKQCHFVNPVDIKRDELMQRAKITGRTTYQRCLRDLHQGGYIIYQPSFNRFVNSTVVINLTQVPDFASG